MKVLLINPPIREWAEPNCVPLGLAYIASVLRNADYEIEVLDINAYRYSQEEVENKVKELKYDFVGIGGLLTTIRYVKWLIEIIKKHRPNVKIMVGGSVSTSIPIILLKNTKADIACIGEGEITAVEIANAIKNRKDLREVKGIYFKDNSGKIIKTEKKEPIKDLDTIPLPAYDLFPMEIYVNNPVGFINKNKWLNGERTDGKLPKSTNINVTRGCPYKCVFCYHDFLGYGYRHHSPEYVLNEMRCLNENYGVTYFLWADDESIINKGFINDFCELMKREKTGFEFSLSGRVNLVNREMLQNLKEAGCTMVGYGVESGSEKILKHIKKGATVEQTKKAVMLTKEIFGDVDTALVIGFAEETEETIRDSINFYKEVDLVPEAIFFATPYPGTELYDDAIKKGLIKDETDYVFKLWEQGEQISVNFTKWSDKELFAIREGMIRELNAWNKYRHGR